MIAEKEQSELEAKAEKTCSYKNKRFELQIIIIVVNFVIKTKHAFRQMFAIILFTINI